MKRMITLVFVSLIFSVPVMAQGGLIGLYIDAWGNECDIEDTRYRIIEVQVVHKFAPSAGAAQFAIQGSSGFTGVYLGEEIPASLPWGAGIGNSQRGISLAYGECRHNTVHILTIRYILYGTSAPLSYLEVIAHPTARPPGIYMVDCSTPVPELYTAVGGRAYINNDGSANCTTTPVRTTTWGGIKALYAE